jgi:hypothetical protein
MCTNVRPDFNLEEVASVEKDRRELLVIVEDMADHLPKEDPSKGDTREEHEAVAWYVDLVTGCRSCHRM